MSINNNTQSSFLKMILDQKTNAKNDVHSNNEKTSIICSLTVTQRTPVVKFHNVEIRKYSIIVGDNPSCSCGPPISLGWNYDKERRELPLDVYEKNRDGQRRSIHHMKIPANERIHILRERDVSSSEIIRAQAECEVIQKQRSQTLRKYERKQSSMYNRLISKRWKKHDSGQGFIRKRHNNDRDVTFMMSC